MKLSANVRPVEAAGLQQTSNFTINASPKAFQILSANLYSDRPLAVVREIICNAWDAHCRAGTQDTPIRIHLPTALDSEFRVRDYGTGLSHTAMHTLYTGFFLSDKADSNDEIGGLGLGSKAPMSYVDQFTVRSYQNGQKRTYHAYITASGTPALADIGTPEETDEPNGLEVIVPVKPADRDTFGNRCRGFIKYLPTIPQINGPAVEPPKYITEFALPDGTYVRLFKNDTWHHSALVLMGHVPYRLTAAQACINENILNNPQLMIEVPVGTFDVAPSREQLSLTQDQELHLRDLCETIAQHLRDDFNTKILAAKDLIEAMNIVWNMPSAVMKSVKEIPAWKTYELGTNRNGYRSLPEVPRDAGLELVEFYATRQTNGMVLKKSNPFRSACPTRPRPTAVLWAPKRMPYRHAVDADTLHTNDWVWVLFGPRDSAERWAKEYGETLTDIPPAPKRRSGAKRSFGAHKYNVAHTSQPDTLTGKYTADEILEQLKDDRPIILARPPYTSSYHTNLTLGKSPLWVMIPDSHSRVRQALLDAGAHETWTDYLASLPPAWINTSAIFWSRHQSRLDTLLRKMPDLDLFTCSKIRTNLFTEDALEHPTAATLRDRLRAIHIWRSRLVYTEANTAARLWPNLEEEDERHFRQFEAFLTCTHTMLTDLLKECPAFQDLSRVSHIPGALLDAYINSKDYSYE